MKRQFLTRDLEAERSFIQLKERKRQLLSDAINYCSKYATITDEKEFSCGFVNYIDSQLREGSRMGNITTNKLLELFDIPIKKIKELEISFKNIHVDLWGKMPDFDLYIDSIDQVDQLKKAQSLCDALNALEVHCDWLLIQRVTQGIVSYQCELSQWQPNYIAILNFKK
jgi:hypothetical protein